MPMSVELVRFRIDWARLMEDEALPPPAPGPASEPGVARATLLLLLRFMLGSWSRREFRDSRFRASGGLLRLLGRRGLGGDDGEEDPSSSLLASSPGGVGSRMLRLKGRRGMGRSMGGPSSGVSDMAEAGGRWEELVRRFFGAVVLCDTRLGDRRSEVGYAWRMEMFGLVSLLPSYAWDLKVFIGTCEDGIFRERCREEKANYVGRKIDEMDEL